MNILFVTTPHEDYLSDSLLHGFWQLPGVDVVDYPRKDILYDDCREEILGKIRGHGFTLYTNRRTGDECDRTQIQRRLTEKTFDLIVFSDIWHQFGLFAQWRPFLCKENTIVLDGADTPQVYPHAGFWWHRPYFWGLPRAERGFLYFKREWTEASRFNLWSRLLPKALRHVLPNYKGLRPIAFGIPKEKILGEVPSKTKEFPRHIVDKELVQKVDGCFAQYAFNDEAEYYADLRASRFGITTKRSGWDCLRHYEIAANGCVPCFRDLDLKPSACAPHGLSAGKNCIVYNTADELLALTASISAAKYGQLANNALIWARANSTMERAREVIETWRNEFGRNDIS